MQQPSLWLVGGFDDSQGLGHRLATALLEACSKLANGCVQLNMTQQRNTAASGSALCTSLAIDLQTGRVQPGGHHLQDEAACTQPQA